MESNTTTLGVSTLAGSSQQVSHTSILWALAALAFNAITQPSISEYVASGEDVEGTLSPGRSSPATCFLDLVIELPIAISSWRRRPANATNDKPTSNATTMAVTMRLAIFALGVLPQAIKLFSIRGIPGTQVLAAIFLATSIVSMMRSLRLESTSDGLAEHWKRIRTSFEGLNTFVRNMRALSRAVHAGLISWTWYQIATAARIETSDDYAYLVSCMRPILYSAIVVYLIWQLARRSWVSEDPRPNLKVPEIAFYAPIFVEYIFKPTTSAPDLGTRAIIFLYTVALLNTAATLCEWLARGLEKCAQWIMYVRTDGVRAQDNMPAVDPARSITSNRLTQIPSTVAIDVTAGTNEHTTHSAAKAKPHESSVPDQGETLTRPGSVHVRAQSKSSSDPHSAMTAGQSVASQSPPQRVPLVERGLNVLTSIFLRLTFGAGSVLVELLFCLDTGPPAFLFTVAIWDAKMDVALAALNLITAGAYYGVAFDGRRTSTPGWTGILG